MAPIVKPPRLVNIVKQAKARNTARLVPTVVDDLGEVGKVVNLPEGRTKVCRYCQKRQPVGNFFLRKRGSPARSSRCRYCAAKHQAAWRLRKKEAAAKSARKKDRRVR